MSVVVLSAGKASRLGGICKALTDVKGRTAIDRQTEALGEKPLLVVHSQHSRFVAERGFDFRVCDEYGGPIRALKAALPFVEFPLTVLFADTLFTRLPTGSDWVGYGYRKGGREWDTIELTPKGVFSARAWYPDDGFHAVAAGAYNFSDRDGLLAAVDEVPDDGPMAWLCNAYPFPLEAERLLGWQDVGDFKAIARFESDGLDR